jgi:hypothetical protein
MLRKHVQVAERPHIQQQSFPSIPEKKNFSSWSSAGVFFACLFFRQINNLLVVTYFNPGPGSFPFCSAFLVSVIFFR